MIIKRSIDIEEELRAILEPYMAAYCPPLPARYKLPSILIQQTGGSDLDTVDTFTVSVDARAKTEAEANELLRNAVGILRQKAKEGDTAIRHVTVNSSGSWGQDPARPDLAMFSATILVTAHLKNVEV